MTSFDRTSLLSSIDSAPELLLTQLALGIACTATMLLILKREVSPRRAKLGAFFYILYIIHFPLLLLAYFVMINSGTAYSMQLAWTAAFAGGAVCILIAKCLAGLLENPRAQRAAWSKLKFALAEKYAKAIRQ